MNGLEARDLLNIAQIYQTKALDLAGCAEGDEALMHAKRYRMLAEIVQQRDALQFQLTKTEEALLAFAQSAREGWRSAHLSDEVTKALRIKNIELQDVLK